MNFCSDNITGAATEILDAIIGNNARPLMPYGADDITTRVEAHFTEIFERDCTVFLVATGTAANALALAAITPPWGSIVCHHKSHINVSECGAPEFFTGGAKLIALRGADARLAPQDVFAAGVPAPHGVHGVQPAALSLTQATEAGTIYTPADLAALTGAARKRGLKVHMDGARFANAVAALGIPPADLSWRAGVDVLSFGASKNGALAAEAVIFFDPELAETFAYRRKRAGHLFAKMRLLAVQMEAYLTNDLWLRFARHANIMAERLAAGLAGLPGAALVHPRESNQVFIDLPEAVIVGLEAAGFAFYRWGAADTTCIRLVCAFDTRPEDVDALIARAARLSAT
jgi:threonine aldolase